MRLGLTINNITVAVDAVTNSVVFGKVDEVLRSGGLCQNRHL